MKLIKDIMVNPTILVVQQIRDSFLQGLNLYENRLNKEYSLTDCIYMEVMKQLNIIGILTHDQHFSQEGFMLLFRD